MREQLKRIRPLVAAVHAARAAGKIGRRAAEDASFAIARTRRERHIAAYLANHLERKLQLGTGSNPMPGWLNTDVTDYRRRGDIIYLDAREPFPLPNASFDLVFSEHTIEHLTYAEGRRCLAECHRILRPGGRIRLATPSVTRLTALYGTDLDDLQQRYLRWSIDTFAQEADAYLPGFVLNNIFYNFAHQFVYDEQTLAHALTTAGFADVRKYAVGESDDPRLADLERHMRSVAEFNAYETLVLEARRP